MCFQHVLQAHLEQDAPKIAIVRLEPVTGLRASVMDLAMKDGLGRVAKVSINNADRPSLSSVMLIG